MAKITVEWPLVEPKISFLGVYERCGSFDLKGPLPEVAKEKRREHTVFRTYTIYVQQTF